MCCVLAVPEASVCVLYYDAVVIEVSYDWDDCDCAPVEVAYAGDAGSD